MAQLPPRRKAEQMENKFLLSVDEVMAATGLGRTTIFSLFKSGKLKAVKIGARTFVRPEDLRTFIDAAAERSAA
ncbi:helix-turn-helix domain-containing protein [Microvirga sp. TS319]|uniref:helix-turn-helix domain-containing protein n=1 Tax=Microvirga sp. TS319 TaxID=3241165 RepID=UPI003519E53C